MAQWEPKLGDVVALKSAPEQPMTVIGYDTKVQLYGVMWLSPDAQGHVISLPAAALQKHEALEGAQVDAAQLTAALEQAGSEVNRLRAELAQAIEMNQNAGRQLAGASAGLRKIVPPEAWSTDLGSMSIEAVTRHETIKREANEQISRLAQRVRELGG